jgi:hypothetical protein
MTPEAENLVCSKIKFECRETDEKVREHVQRVQERYCWRFIISESSTIETHLNSTHVTVTIIDKE